MDPRRLRALGLTLLAIAVIAALAIFGLRSEHAPAHGRKAPELPAERLVGGPVTIPDLLASAHGRPSLVLFWASWCGPCVREAPAIERFSQAGEGRGRLVGGTVVHLPLSLELPQRPGRRRDRRQRLP